MLTAIGAASSLFAQALDPDVVAKIREEGLNHSQLMPTLEYLSDVIGPRLTGSPAMLRANEWTRDKLTSWGLSNAHLEAWGEFGRGWQLDRFSAQVIAPMDIPLIAFPKAWSPSLRGPVTAEVVLIDATDAAALAKYKGQLRGKIVLTSAERPIAARFEAQGRRFTDEQLTEMADAKLGQGGAGFGGGGRRRGQGGQRNPNTATGGPGAGGPPGAPTADQMAARRAQAQQAAARLRFFMDEGVVAVFDSSPGDDGTITVQSASVPPAAPMNAANATMSPSANQNPGAPAPAAPARPIPVWDKSAPKTIPQIVVSAEHYNRMVRMIHNGVALKVLLDLKCSFPTPDKEFKAYNTVAEIPGSDLKDQIVVCGGHMDSWHAGTGATDNGAGLAVAMEAVRILKTLNLPLRRTVRVCLWSGEEEGLFGSRGYVTQHLGSYPQAAGGGFAGGFNGAAVDRGPLTKGPEWDKVSAYFNLDNGTGKIRGIYAQSNPAVVPIFTEWLKPFADLGATTVTIRNTGSTDHVSFDAVGVPGFEFLQDPIEYQTRTHHTNQDVFDRVQGDDERQAAVIMAAFLYATANRDQMIPRKPVAGA